MSDQRAALAELADAVGRASDDGSLDSERAIQLRAVEPLIETLDWDVRGPDVVPEADVGGQMVEYLLQIEETPAVAVRTEGPRTSSLEAAASQLESMLVRERLSRGIVTDGRSIVLVLVEDEDAHRRSISFAALPEHSEALGQFHRTVLETATGQDRTDRRAAAQRVAQNRETIEDAVTAEIVSVTGTEFEDVVAAESSRTIEAVLAALDPAADAVERSIEHETDPSAEDDVDAQESDAIGADATTDRAQSDDSPTTDSPAADTQTAERPPESSTTEAGDSAPGGEYVVRFFGGASSVGAVGTQSPAGTVLGVVRYLLENHDLESSLTLPWQTSSGATLLAASGEPPDWTILENADGKTVAVHSIDDASLAREAIEELTAAAGLRVMFQGDW